MPVTKYPEAESNVHWSKQNEKILEFKECLNATYMYVCIPMCTFFQKVFFFKIVIVPLFEELGVLPLFYSENILLF